MPGRFAQRGSCSHSVPLRAPRFMFTFLSPGVHWNLCRGDVRQAGGHGPLLLLPGRLELLRRLHRDLELGGAGAGRRGGTVRAALFPFGKQPLPFPTTMFCMRHGDGVNVFTG